MLRVAKKHHEDEGKYTCECYPGSQHAENPARVYVSVDRRGKRTFVVKGAEGRVKIRSKNQNDLDRQPKLLRKREGYQIDFRHAR